MKLGYSDLGPNTDPGVLTTYGICLECAEAPGDCRDQPWTLLVAEKKTERPSSWVSDPVFLFPYLPPLLPDVLNFLRQKSCWLQIPNSPASTSQKEHKPAVYTMRIPLFLSFHKEFFIVVSLSILLSSSTFWQYFFLRGWFSSSTISCLSCWL